MWIFVHKRSGAFVCGKVENAEPSYAGFELSSEIALPDELAIS